MPQLSMCTLTLLASVLVQVRAGGWLDNVHGMMNDMESGAESAGSHMLSAAVNGSKHAAGVMANGSFVNGSFMNQTLAAINQTRTAAMRSVNQTRAAAMRWVGDEQKAACLSTVKRSLEEANVTLHKQLYADCASSAALVPLAAAHFNDTCKSLGELYIQHTMSEQNSTRLEACYKSANTSLDWRAALSQWSSESKAKMYQSFDGLSSKAIEKAKTKLALESKFAMVGHIAQGDVHPWLVVAPASCVAVFVSFTLLAFAIGRRNARRSHRVDAALLIEPDVEALLSVE